MSYIIGMVSQKGGAGKSTLARLFARELAKDGFAVKIADLDTQQTTCTEWAADRAEAKIEPEIQVQPFGNIKTALAEAPRFDAYILDIGLPGMDGYELAGELRRQPGFDNTRLVALSGYGQQADQARSRAAGFAAHLVKPITPAQLYSLLAKH